MLAIDLSRGKVTKPTAVNERNEMISNRKIIFETDSIEISIKNEPEAEDIPEESDEGNLIGLAQNRVILPHFLTFKLIAFICFCLLCAYYT